MVETPTRSGARKIHAVTAGGFATEPVISGLLTVPGLASLAPHGSPHPLT